MSILQDKIVEFDLWMRENHNIEYNEPISFVDTSGWLWEEETKFKTNIFKKAHEALDYEDWKESDIGTGLIRDRLKTAIQCDSSIINRNQRKDLLESLDKSKSLENLELVIYNLYKMDNDQQSMDDIVNILPRRYDAISYLFFIKDSEKYLPVKSNTFDKCLKKVGIDYTLSGNCGWDNFKGFMEILRYIAEELNKTIKIKPEATLLDAHSFLWIIGNQMMPPLSEENDYPAFRNICVGDGYVYKTQKDIVSYFHKTSKPTSGATNLNNNYMLWYIQLNKPGAAWQNDISADGLYITESNKNKPHEDELETCYRITFANSDGKGFKFVGVFKLEAAGSKSYLENIIKELVYHFIREI